MCCNYCSSAFGTTICVASYICVVQSLLMLFGGVASVFYVVQVLLVLLMHC